MVGVEADGERDAAAGLRRALHGDDALQVGARDRADAADGHPVLREAHGLARLQELVGHLVLEQPGLDLHVLAVVVGEQAAPEARIVIVAPAVDLLAGQHGGVGIVDGAGVCMRAVDAEERLVAAVGEGVEVALLARDHAQVGALQIDGPGIRVVGAVVADELRGIVDVRVRPHLDAGVVPPEIVVAGIAVVGEGDVLLQQRAAGAQDDLHRPVHAVDAVAIAHGDGGAAVGRGGVGPVNRRLRDPVVRDGEVELLAEGRPRAAIGDGLLLERRIGIEHGRVVDLVDAGVDVAAELGQDGALQVLVLQNQRAPGVDRLRGAHGLAHGVGIVFQVGEGVEVRVLVRRVFVGGGELERPLPDLDLGVRYRQVDAT